jgi:hypothetical protein
MGRVWRHVLDGGGDDPGDDEGRQQHGTIVAPLMAPHDRCAWYS